MWIVVVAVGALTMGLKAIGPALLGGRELPSRVMGVVELLAPAFLAALVATSTFGSGESLVVDERALGVGAAGVALWCRAPVLVAVIAAAAVTAAARAV